MYNSGGNIEWVTTYGYPESVDEGVSIKIDGNGDCYVAGNNYLLHPDFTGKSNRSFVARFNPNGVLLWNSLSEWTGIGGIMLKCLDIQIGGDIIVGGMITEPLTWAGVSISTTVQSIFLARISAAGTLITIKKVGTNWDLLRALRINSSGDILLGGIFTSPSDFGGINLSCPNCGMFIVNLDSNFIGKWGGAARGGQVWSLAWGENNECYATGSFSKELDFNGVIPNLKTIPSKDLFVIKFDQEGKLKWARASDGVVERTAVESMDLAINKKNKIVS
jgi:hypothetical protein